MSNKSFIQSILVSAGTVINSLLGLGFYVVLGRGLGVAGFGYFSYLLGLGLLASEVSDLGFNSALVRFGAGEKFPAIFSLTFLVRFVSSLIILVIFLILTRLFNQPMLFSAAVAITGIFSYLTIQSMIARQKYFWQVAANILGNLLRLGLVWVLFTKVLLTPTLALVTFSLGGAATFLAGLFIIRNDFKFVSLTKITRMWHEAAGYLSGVALSFGLSSLAAKIDIPIVFALAGPNATGLYTSASKLASVFQQIAAAIEGVFAPKFARLDDYRRHFRDYFLVILALVIATIALIPLSPAILPILFGQSYSQAIIVFQILLLAAIFFFASGPFAAAVLYRHGLAKYHLAATLASFLASLIAYYSLVPAFGAIGGALASVANSLVTLVAFGTIWKKLE